MSPTIQDEDLEEEEEEEDDEHFLTQVSCPPHMHWSAVVLGPLCVVALAPRPRVYVLLFSQVSVPSQAIMLF